MNQQNEAIRTQGPPSMTEQGREVFAYHLYRYVGPWLERWGIPRVRVAVGFENSAFGGAIFEVDLMECQDVEVGWTFEDLTHACRFGDGKLRVEGPGQEDTDVWECLPVVDRPATGGEPQVMLGFALYEPQEGLTSGAVSDLEGKVAEALRGARRNGVRMFFDERDSMPVKNVLYDLMEHLPEWFGCDHSAALLMTSTVETMALKESEHGRFDILAERLFVPEEADAEPDRLVGMSVMMGQGEAGVLEAAVERQKDDPELPYQIFEKDGSGEWASRDRDGSWQGYHRVDREPGEKMLVFIPLLSRETPQVELLGFLGLVFRSPAKLSSSVGEVLGQLGRRIAGTLRYSPLYTLSGRKLWLVRQARQKAVDYVESDGDPVERLEELISDVTSMIAYHTEVPSLAVGYIDGASGREDRHLCYAHPHGWTRFDELELPVDVPPEERVDSGVSALAARMGRPFILAGGHGEGDAQSFKNYLWVHEERGEVVDARGPRAAEVLDRDDQDWTLLSDYYKPARGRAYATLAYPITFGEQVLGVITVEVEKATSWVWWTGFGGQLFWEMLADELSWAFRELGPVQ